MTAVILPLPDEPERARRVARRQRKRRYRGRLKAGVIVLGVPVAQNRLAEALIRAERLNPAQTADRAAVAAAVAEVVEEWIRHW